VVLLKSREQVGCGCSLSLSYRCPHGEHAQLLCVPKAFLLKLTDLQTRDRDISEQNVSLDESAE